MQKILTNHTVETTGCFKQASIKIEYNTKLYNTIFV